MHTHTNKPLKLWFFGFRKPQNMWNHQNLHSKILTPKQYSLYYTWVWENKKKWGCILNYIYLLETVVIIWSWSPDLWMVHSNIKITEMRRSESRRRFQTCIKILYIFYCQPERKQHITVITKIRFPRNNFLVFLKLKLKIRGVYKGGVMEWLPSHLMFF